MKTMVPMGIMVWRSLWAVMIGPIVLVCKWKANSSKELVGQPSSNCGINNLELTIQSLSVTVSDGKKTETCINLHSGISTHPH